MELYRRISEETANKIRLEKKIEEEKKIRKQATEKFNVMSDTNASLEREIEAKRRLETEIRHQTEEAERRSLVKKMLADAAEVSPSMNKSCMNVLNNYQGSFHGNSIYLILHYYKQNLSISTL